MKYLTEAGLKKFKEQEDGEWEFFAFLVGFRNCYQQDINTSIKCRHVEHFRVFGAEYAMLNKLEEISKWHKGVTKTSLEFSYNLAKKEWDAKLESYPGLKCCLATAGFKYFDSKKRYVLGDLYTVATCNRYFSNEYIQKQEISDKKDAVSFLYDALMSVYEKSKGTIGDTSGIFTSKYENKIIKNKSEELNFLALIAGMQNCSSSVVVNYIFKNSRICIYQVGMECNKLFRLYDLIRSSDGDVKQSLQLSFDIMKSSIIELNEHSGFNIEGLFDAFDFGLPGFREWFKHNEIRICDVYCCVLPRLACMLIHHYKEDLLNASVVESFQCLNGELFSIEKLSECMVEAMKGIDK